MYMYTITFLKQSPRGTGGQRWHAIDLHSSTLIICSIIHHPTNDTIYIMSDDSDNLEHFITNLEDQRQKEE